MLDCRWYIVGGILQMVYCRWYIVDGRLHDGRL